MTLPENFNFDDETLRKLFRKQGALDFVLGYNTDTGNPMDFLQRMEDLGISQQDLARELADYCENSPGADIEMNDDRWRLMGIGYSVAAQAMLHEIASVLGLPEEIELLLTVAISQSWHDKCMGLAGLSFILGAEAALEQEED